jgi:hypothetical protein
MNQNILIGFFEKLAADGFVPDRVRKALSERRRARKIGKMFGYALGPIAAAPGTLLFAGPAAAALYLKKYKDSPFTQGARKTLSRSIGKIKEKTNRLLGVT